MVMVVSAQRGEAYEAMNRGRNPTCWVFATEEVDSMLEPLSQERRVKWRIL